jgi:hypothetical protein
MALNAQVPTIAAPSLVYRALAGLLRIGGAGLNALAERLAPQSNPLPSAHLEFHAEAGAPEGALYANGVLVARLPGVKRL